MCVAWKTNIFVKIDKLIFFLENLIDAWILSSFCFILWITSSVLSELSVRASQVSLFQILMCVFFKFYISELNTVTQLAFSIKEKCGEKTLK